MFDKLNAVESRYGELVTLLADPAVQNDTTKYREHAKALSEIQPLVDTYKIPSSNQPGGMTVLNAAMKKCGQVLGEAAGGQG